MAGAPSAGDRLTGRTIGRTGPALRGPALFVARLLSLVAMAALLAACDGGSGAATTLTEADDGITVRVAVEETVEVRLASNPTTGYEWRLVEEPDDTVVQVLSSDYVPDETPADQPIAGSGGTEAWTFGANGPGEATVSMAYSFGGQPDQEEADSFSFTVIVE